jgi:hypothetical protein
MLPRLRPSAESALPLAAIEIRVLGPARLAAGTLGIKPCSSGGSVCASFHIRPARPLPRNSVLVCCSSSSSAGPNTDEQRGQPSRAPARSLARPINQATPICFLCVCVCNSTCSAPHQLMVALLESQPTGNGLSAGFSGPVQFCRRASSDCLPPPILTTGSQ